METAYFAGGCFWCTEAIFESLRGVTSVVSGYAGGKIKNPEYIEVSSGTTGHAEAIKITYNPKEIKFRDLVYVFFKTHDPTTLDKQGEDEGSQYRSVVFYENQKQKKLAQETVQEIQKDYPAPIVTEISKLDKFYEAEDYHQDYYKNNSEKMYCKLVIDPKIRKLKKDLGKYL